MYALTHALTGVHDCRYVLQLHMLRDIEHALGIGEQHALVDADAGELPPFKTPFLKAVICHYHSELD